MNAFEGAKRKGFIAGLQGKLEDECPYKDIRAGKYDHIVTWSRGFQHAWLEGWKEGFKKYREIIAHPKWSKPVLHRCPLCGYENDATNICRRCMVPMEVVVDCANFNPKTRYCKWCQAYIKEKAATRNVPCEGYRRARKHHRVPDFKLIRC